MDHRVTNHKIVHQTKETSIENIRPRANNETQGLHKLMKGQRIMGTITSVSEGITISLQGYELTAPAGMFEKLTVGDSILFEVLKISGSHIELSAIDHETLQNGKIMEAIVRLDADREVFLSRKKQEGKESEREEEHKNKMSKIEEFLSKMTEKDYQAIEEEGFSVEDLTVSGLGAAIDRLHASRTKAFGDQGHSGSRSKDKKAFTAEQIEQKMKQANLPANEDTVRKVMTALDLCASVGKLDEAAMKHLIGMELPPTLENLYKAQYSKGTAGNTGKLTEETWAKLLPQVEEVIRASGYEVNAENLNRARWLVENQLPLTKDNFIYYSRLSSMEEITDRSEALDQILQDMKNGIAPKDAIVIPGQQDNLQRLVERLDTVREEELKDAVRTKKEITIKLLTDKKYREEYLKEVQNKELTEEQQLEAVRAQRQLEELRLKMTTQAAATLERKGIHVETESLHRLVEELKQLEESYYSRLFAEAEHNADIDQINLLRDTTRGMEQLKAVPSYVLGTTLSDRKQITIQGLMDEGLKISDQLARAKEAYETLMTEPNREYGDSIQKAFRNSDSLLSELGLESTVYNQRAVRILGYNRMEITQENLALVKAYDLEVNTLMQRLHPAVAVRLIKDGINPMGTPISELNQRIDQLRQEQGITSEEKFSTYLRRLEKQEELSKEERQAYIGIYRLLHNIDKTDGAALGAVIKADREITLNSLLTAVRSLHKGAVDTVVDDSFGGLQGLKDGEATITDQLGAVFGTEDTAEVTDASREISEGMEARTEFHNLILKQLLSEASPEGFNELQQKLYHAILPSLQASSEFAPLLSSGKGIWEQLKDVPVERLFDMLGATQAPEEEAVYTGKLMELKQAYQNADQAVRFLEDFKVPCTTTNIMIAGQILNNSSPFFRRYFQLREENTRENVKSNLQEMEGLADTLIDKDSAQMTYNKVEVGLKEVLEQESQSERIDSLRLTELKHMKSQMLLMKTLAQREFYQIPIETGQGITNMNLTIIRGKGSTGRVAVSLATEALGSVKADISLKDRTLNGYIASDSRMGAQLMTDNLQGIKSMLQEEDITVKQLEVCYDRFARDTYTYQQQEKEGVGNQRDPETERLLYRIARTVVLAVTAAETQGHQTAVS